MTTDAEIAAAVRGRGRADEIFVLLQPGPALCDVLDVSVQDIPSAGPVEFFTTAASGRRRRLRSLHPVREYRHPRGVALATVSSTPETPNAGVWLLLKWDGSDVLILGNAVAADLIGYRQGDMAKAEGTRPGVIGGFAHERANHLFEDQRAGEDPYERHADTMAVALADVVSAILDLNRTPLLPGGAPGAIVVTGDDDQAYPERYAKQLELLDDLPVTYFLHPLTRLTPARMRRLFAGRCIELGLHPDALDDPEAYTTRLSAQAEWFEKLVGFRAVSVRNHGFLSRGYWDFVPDWLDCGLRISSNLTAADGTALNGSYLPARIVRDGRLTEHWSLLTALGDGLLFAHRHTPEQAANKVRSAGDALIGSDPPGVLVVNLHPQNVDLSAPMHRAVLDLVEAGFYAWTLQDCVAWFRSRDGGTGDFANATFRTGGMVDWLARYVDKLRA